MGNKRVVHIVDDEETIRKALSFTLRTAGFAVEAYASGSEFLLSAEDAEKGCVVLDMHMPDMDGLQVQAELTRRGIDMPVVVLTGNGDPTLAVQAMKAGAADFIEKPFDDDTMLSAIRKALTEKTGDEQIRNERREVLDRLALLSTREREVVDGLVDGKANKVIAFDLDISPRTVEVYRANAMMKMQARTLSDLVRMVTIARLA